MVKADIRHINSSTLAKGKERKPSDHVTISCYPNFQTVRFKAQQASVVRPTEPVLLQEAC